MLAPVTYQPGFPVAVLQGFLVAHQVVERGVLHEGGEDEDEAHGDEEVHGCDVGHSGQVLAGDGAQGGHGEHGRDT